MTTPLANIDAMGTLKRMAEALSGSAYEISIGLDAERNPPEFRVRIHEAGRVWSYPSGQHSNLRIALDRALTSYEDTLKRL